MPKLARVLTAVAAFLLIAAFFLPLWRIDLLAPQYPEGLGMRIWINNIAGVGEYDLDNINGLNHYIGMKAIEPDSIAELRYMPWIIGVLAVSGVAVALLGRRRGLYAWVAALFAAGAAGLADFYRWGYDYGHNLAADAIIKVPGMAYQPPLIGEKVLLNFTATSWPDTGGYAVLVAMLLALAAAVVAWREGRTAPRQEREHRAGQAAAVTAAVLILAACAASGPIHIAYDGSETCALCRMAVTDRRFGAQLVTSTGKALNFDSIECLGNYVARMPAGEEVRGIWVPDFRHPGTMVEADDARFVRGSRVASPMGAGMLAFAPGEPATDSALIVEFGGRVASWDEVAGKAR